MATSSLHLSAESFIEIWKEFDRSFIQKHIVLYNSSKDWTEFIIGTKKSAYNCDSNLGDFIRSKTGFSYRKEDGLVDLTFANGAMFNDLLTLDYPMEGERRRFSLNGKFYPKYYDVLIEHENNIARCWEEMIKLTYFRARLKVLITYNWDVDSNSNYNYVNDVLATNFKQIISESSTELDSELSTEYLLIIGKRDASLALTWDFIIMRNLINTIML